MPDHPLPPQDVMQGFGGLGVGSGVSISWALPVALDFLLFFKDQFLVLEKKKKARECKFEIYRIKQTNQKSNWLLGYQSDNWESGFRGAWK